MSDSTLLLRLEAPLQSWGTRARWDIRDTAYEPTKSGIIGMIGCARGLKRGDPHLEKLDRILRFGVRIDRPGTLGTDFQTVTGYHRTAAGEFKHGNGHAKDLQKAMEHQENTIVSPRDYLHDASFLAALMLNQHHQQADSDLLTEIANCLKNPKWPLYLGRKACVPTRPVFERVTDDYKDLEDALRNEPWCCPGWHPTSGAEFLEAWIECRDGEFERQDAMRINQLRFYDFRRCRRIEIPTEPLRRTV